VVIVVVWVLCAIFGDSISPNDPLVTNPLDRLQPPSADHWFGTDSLGRDLFARVMIGGREMLVIAPTAALLATALGATLGLIGGYVGGAIDEVIGRLVDAFLALPVVIFATLVLVALGSSRLAIILAVGIPLAPIVARSVRAAVLSERDLDYIDAARLRNERTAYIVFSEILPNVRAVIIVEFVMRMAYAVFAVATLNFIGVGVQRPAPDWGRQILEEYYYLLSGDGVWGVLFPALGIASLVVGVSLIADGVTEALDQSA
jgi:peptide/nickel transport system permease protein